MVGWRDGRRRRFFELFIDDIYVHDDGQDNELLLLRNRVNIKRSRDETAADIHSELQSIRRSLRSLNPIDEENDEELVFDTGEKDAAFKAASDHPDRLAPSHILIAQQRVQPGDDPEPSPRLPEPDRTSKLGEGVKVAVVDTGIAPDDGGANERARMLWFAPNDAEKVALLGERAYGVEGRDVDRLYGNRTEKGQPQERLLAWAAGHGTFIASLIRQTAPAVDIIPIRIGGGSEMGYETERNVEEGIRRAIAEGAHIINLSWGSYTLPQEDPANYATNNSVFRLYQAVEEAIENHIVVVAAAGNSGSRDPMYPAAWKGVTAVGALDRDGSRWDRSNYGPWVDAWAPGVKLRGDYVKGKEDPANDPDGHPETWDNKNNFATWTGTSFAAPLVAAQIAIVQSATRCEAPEARDRLLNMSKPARDDPSGKRILVDIPGQT